MNTRIYIRLFYESLAMALQSLVSNKLRSFLSLLGITIGIFSIVLVFTLVDSLEMNIKNSIQSMGKDVIYIDKWQWVGGSDYPWWKFLNRPDARLQEVKALEEHPVSELADAISFTSSAGTTAKAGDKSIENTNVAGYTADFSKIENLELTEGRFFNEFEDINGKAVAVIGYEIAMGLFERNTNLLGKKITVFGKQAEIIGVFKNQGDNLINIDFDDKIAVPIRFLRYINPGGGSANIIVKAKESVGADGIYEELRGSMRSIRRLKPKEEDNFTLNKISFLSETIGEFFKSVNMFGLIIGLFSLLVGGFGVANIMFVSVKERTSIIGIQKALGARNEFILFNFLTEAIVLSIVGGLLGILLTWSVAGGINLYLASTDNTFRLMMTMGNFLNGIFFSSIIGLLSGVIPALRASRLVPVEAIRSK